MREPQDFERDWWGNCANTYVEEMKQIVYASRMGLTPVSDYGKWPVYAIDGPSVVDFGGGPVSLLLKCRGVSNPLVVDPCDYPAWVRARYNAAGIVWWREPGETFHLGDIYNEAWIYNVLQHVVDPEALVENARKSAHRIRIFEWIDTPPSEGHPHTLRAKELDKWLGGKGKTEYMDKDGCYGPAYYGVFG
jgi:hypothetical protein